MKYLTIPSKSSLQNFARWFSQDFDLLAPDLETFGQSYIGQLPAQEREVLGAALQDLLEQYPGKSENGIRNAWRRLGAVIYPRPNGLRTLLALFLRLCEEC